MVSANERQEDWVKYHCPRNCPFNKRLGDLRTRYCNFAAYADVLEPGRHTRTEIDPDGHINYHKWPDCDVYHKYKNLKNVINEALRRQRVEHIEKIRSEADTFVTARKHPATSKHKQGREIK